MGNNYSTLVENGLNPNIIDEVSEDVTYLGFAKGGDLTKCAIVRIATTGTIRRFECPQNGLFEFDKDWSERANYTYQLRKI